jgi:hypothetical protein
VVAFLLPLLRLLKLHLPLFPLLLQPPLSPLPLLPLLHPQFQWLRQRRWLRMSLRLRLWLNTLAPIRLHLGHII